MLNIAQWYFILTIEYIYIYIIVGVLFLTYQNNRQIVSPWHSFVLEILLRVDPGQEFNLCINNGYYCVLPFYIHMALWPAVYIVGQMYMNFSLLEMRPKWKQTWSKHACFYQIIIENTDRTLVESTVMVNLWCIWIHSVHQNFTNYLYTSTWVNQHLFSHKQSSLFHKHTIFHDFIFFYWDVQRCSYVILIVAFLLIVSNKRQKGRSGLNSLRTRT